MSTKTPLGISDESTKHEAIVNQESRLPVGRGRRYRKDTSIE
jgi:hypothetical protein